MFRVEYLPIFVPENLQVPVPNLQNKGLIGNPVQFGSYPRSCKSI